MQRRSVTEVGRDELRRAALKTGQIYFGDPQERRDCLVWDLKKSGAMIEVTSDAGPLQTLRLISAALYVNQLCEVVWRDGRKIGLKFAS